MRRTSRCWGWVLRNGYWTGRQCSRKPTVTGHDGHGYCWQHVPPTPTPLIDVLTDEQV